MATILIVEDEERISDFIEKGLVQAGHTCLCVRNAHEADGYVLEKNLDLAIVDVMLQGGRTGLQMVGGWRGQGVLLPVLFLSARDRLEDKLAGFESGGDDYLTKPYSFSELLARVNSLLKRKANPVSQNTLAFEDLILDIKTRMLERGGVKIALQKKEFVLIELMMEHPGVVFSKTMIMERVWGYNFDPQTNVVDVLISRLRAKIDKEFKAHYIQTVRGIGYVLKKAGGEN